jgi:hypothetical protein
VSPQRSPPRLDEPLFAGPFRVTEREIRTAANQDAEDSDRWFGTAEPRLPLGRRAASWLRMTGPGPLTHRDACALAGAPPSPHSPHSLRQVGWKRVARFWVLDLFRPTWSRTLAEPEDSSGRPRRRAVGVCAWVSERAGARHSKPRSRSPAQMETRWPPLQAPVEVSSSS